MNLRQTRNLQYLGYVLALTVLPFGVASAADIEVTGNGINLDVACDDLSAGTNLTCEQRCQEIDQTTQSTCTVIQQHALLTIFDTSAPVTLALSGDALVYAPTGTGAGIEVDLDPTTMSLATQNISLVVTATDGDGNALGVWQGPFDVELPLNDGVSLAVTGTSAGYLEIGDAGISSGVQPCPRYPCPTGQFCGRGECRYDTTKKVVPPPS